MGSADHNPLLNDDDALSMWVGRVARIHAQLEHSVYNVHTLLLRHDGQLSGRQSVKGLDQLITESRKLLRESRAGAEIRMPGDGSLAAAKEATARRNRVVHDMWLPSSMEDGSGPPRWNTFRRLGDLDGNYAAGVLQDLSTVVETHRLVVRARMRVSGLFMALHAFWPSTRGSDRRLQSSDNMARYVALMTDRFVLHPNGDFDVTAAADA